PPRSTLRPYTTLFRSQTYEYYAKVVFLCASGLNSTWILMNSATDIWPEGLGSSSGELGHNLMDHHFRCGASGKAEGYEDKYYFGDRKSTHLNSSHVKI